MNKLTLLFLAMLSLNAVAEEKKGFDTVGEVFIAIGNGIDNTTDAVVETSTDAADWVENDSEGWFETKGDQLSVFFGISDEDEK